jgi:hypothetical protein
MDNEDKVKIVCGDSNAVIGMPQAENLVFMDET